MFLAATLASLASFVVIFIAVDMMEKLDKFIDRKVPWDIVAEYYINFLPQMVSLILPIGLLLGSLFATGKLSQNSEIIAMRSGGMSLYRFMLPYVIIALLASGAAMYMNGWLAPEANARMLTIKREYLKDNIVQNVQMNMHMQNAPGEFLVVGNFNISQGKAERIGLYQFDPSDRTRLIRRVDAKQMSWDSTKKMWRLSGAVERIFGKDSTQEIYRTLDEKESLVKLAFTPKDLRDRQLSTNETSEITIPDLERRIELAKSAGKDVARDEVDYYAKFSMAFSALIVVLFGVPFASQKKRGGLAVQFSVALGIAFIYLAFTKISFTFGYSGEIPPVLTAWLANGLFIIIAIIVMLRVQK
jgi:lipopolysaccharide export system permease protein